MNEIIEPPGPRQSRALERAQSISRILADAARRARFSARARGSYEHERFQSRRGARAMRLTRIALFVLLVVVSNLVSVAYFGFLASDQYVSEAKFTVSSGAIPKLDGLGTVTGVPQMTIMQDTLIITNYIESRTLVEKLEREVKLRDLYSARKIDWWARFLKDKPIEKFTDYWNKMASTSISYPAGIVTLTVRAFSPADSKRVADAVVSNCEKLINELNERMRRDMVSASEQDVTKAAQKLKDARLALQQARNSEGIIDVRQESKSLGELLGDLERDLLKAKQEYETQLHYVSESAPQMRVMNARISALSSQIDEMKAQITAREERRVSDVTRQTLSGKMTKFSTLDLEHQIAEKRYSAAITALDSARMRSDRKMLYLHQIVAPATPEEARYPRRWLDMGIVLGGSLLAWATIVGLMTFVRNHMA